MLTNIEVKNARPREAAYKLSDANGLHLLVQPGGGKYWRMAYRFAGKQKTLAFGVYPEVSLSEARGRGEGARRMIRDGDDPGVARKQRRIADKHNAINTFESVARDWLKHSTDKWVGTTKAQIEASLEADIFPMIGARPIAEVKPREVITAIKAIETRGAGETAMRVLQRVRAVFRYAVAHERVESNPVAEVRPGEILKPRQVTHRAALPQKELPDFLRRLAVYEGDPTTRLALQLLILTAVRPGEVRGARWDEIDVDAAQWRIPAARMKMRIEHVVPLSRQALAVIEEMRPLSAAGELMFPSPFYPTKSLSENTLNSALARMGYKGYATAHGFRAVFSTIANEAGWDADVIERQLAHTEGDKVRAAYHRAAYLPERGKLMQWWGDWLDAQEAGAEVVPIRREAA